MFTFKTQPRCRKTVSFIITIAFLGNFILPTQGFAQALALPAPGTMIGITPAFAPPIIKGLEINPDNPFQFNFFVNSGEDNLQGEALKAEAEKLIRYFLASLTMPENDLWVNLSPYEKDRIIEDTLSTTELGRDLLAEDYMLKQLMASVLYPEDELGKKFWDKVYKKSFEKFGTTEISTETFHKVWILPGKATVYEHGNRVFVTESSLKVMLEEDYVALSSNKNIKVKESNNAISTAIIRDIVIPEIEKEVNFGKHFAQLRQIYNSLILANWFKETLKQSLLGKVYVDQKKTQGINTEDPAIKQEIYNQYLEAFKTGAYSYIKVEYDTNVKRNIPRKYFSGGANLAMKTDIKKQHVLSQEGYTAIDGEKGSSTVKVKTLFTEHGEGAERSGKATMTDKISSSLKVPDDLQFPIKILSREEAEKLFEKLVKKPIARDFEIAQLPEDLGKRLVGGKSYQLAIMWGKDPENNFRSFSGTTTAADQFLESDPELLNFVYERIRNLDSSDEKQREKIGAEIRARIKNTPIPDHIQEMIKFSYESLAYEAKIKEMAVRSSGRAEDIKLEEIPEMAGINLGASAGQHDTYLGVPDAETAVNRWRDDVASLYTDRAIDYRDGMMVYIAFGKLLSRNNVQKVIKTLGQSKNDDDKLAAKALETRDIKIISSLRLSEVFQRNNFKEEVKIVEQAREDFINVKNISMGVTIMPMADAQVSFVLFGADLNTGWTGKDFQKIPRKEYFNKGRTCTITTNYNLGESIVQGVVTPDSYLVHMFEEGGELRVNILSRQLGTKMIQAVYKEPLMRLLEISEEALNDYIELVKPQGQNSRVLAEKFEISESDISIFYNVLNSLVKEDVDRTDAVRIHEDQSSLIQRVFGFNRHQLNKLAHVIKESLKDAKTKTVFTDVEPSRRDIFAATDSQIVAIAKEAYRKAEGYENILDMEGVVGRNLQKPNTVITVQRRPSNAEVDVSDPQKIAIDYTYIKTKDVESSQEKHNKAKNSRGQLTDLENGELLVSGIPTRNAFTGEIYVIDPAKGLVGQFEDIKKKAAKTKIIIRTRETTPDYLPVMKHENVVGIIADVGGATSHAAVVSRELGIATVVGVISWLDKLSQTVGERKASQIKSYLNKSGNIVTVDANVNENSGNGTIYAGSLPISRREIKIDISRLPKVYTKVGYIMGMPHPMLTMSKMAQYPGFSGVALMRAEFVYGEENINPRAGVAYDNFLIYTYLMMNTDYRQATKYYEGLNKDEKDAVHRFEDELARREKSRREEVPVPMSRAEKVIQSFMDSFDKGNPEGFVNSLSETGKKDLWTIQHDSLRTDGEIKVIKELSERLKGYLTYDEFFAAVHGGAVSLMAAANSQQDNTVVYRSIDFKKNEARSLIGSKMFDPNPEPATMIGERGARWLLRKENQIILREEIRMLLRQIAQGYKNLGFMFPFVATPQELDELLTILEEEEKTFSKEAGEVVYIREVGQMIELPSNVIQADEFAKILNRHQKEITKWFKENFDVKSFKRASFFSFGTNDLTQTTMGADRDNHDMKHLMNEAHPFVIESIRHVVNIAKKYNIKCGLCGQAIVNLVEKDPETAEEILMMLGSTGGYAGTDYLGTEKTIIRSAAATLKHGVVKDPVVNSVVISDFESDLKRGAATRLFFHVKKQGDFEETYIGDFVSLDPEILIDFSDDKIKDQISRLGAVVTTKDISQEIVEKIKELGVPVIFSNQGQLDYFNRLPDKQMITVDFLNQRIYKQEVKVEIQVPAKESKITGVIAQEAREPKVEDLGNSIKVSDFYKFIKVHPLAFYAYDELSSDARKEKLGDFVIDEIESIIKKLQANDATEAYQIMLTNYIKHYVKAGEPFVFETSDMESDDFSGLRGGRVFSPEEVNPPLGVAGLDALIREGDTRQLFKIELEVIKNLIEEGYQPAIQFNSVKIPEHLKEALKVIKEVGIDIEKTPLPLGINTAWPGNYLFLNEFIDAGKLSFIDLDKTRLAQGYWAADIASGKNQHVIDFYKSSEMQENLKRPVQMIKNSVANAGISLKTHHVPASDSTIPPPTAGKIAVSSPGGIDFNKDKFDLQIKRDENGVSLPMKLQDLENININGLVPVILNYTIVTNLPMLLGYSVKDENIESETVELLADEPRQISYLN
ncbi:MAG: putative PEP-binding protein [Candidatus Aceula meridiana]|nr:putative PEP-binding protein [Candidatus Aceula meridiana]